MLFILRIILYLANNWVLNKAYIALHCVRKFCIENVPD